MVHQVLHARLASAAGCRPARRRALIHKPPETFEIQHLLRFVLAVVVLCTALPVFPQGKVQVR